MRTTITAIMTDGDATDPAVLARLLEGDAAARFVLTGEPYNLRIAGNVTGGPHREFAMASGEMTDAEFLAFTQHGLPSSSLISATVASASPSSTGGAYRRFRPPRQSWASSRSA